jgi:hypothetical protein
VDGERAKRLAQQLAVEAVSLVLPTFRSVEPIQVAEFRSEVQPLVRPFRTEMVKLTADLSTAIAAGATEDELRGLCRGIVDSKVGPALADLARQLRDPVRPFRKVIVDVSEGVLAAASSTMTPKLTVGWALLRGAKIASEYVTALQDREGKRKSGLAYLLAVNQKLNPATSAVSDWDSINWRCSGCVNIPDPGFPLTPLNRQVIAEGLFNWLKPETQRQLFQTKTMSIVHWGPKTK